MRDDPTRIYEAGDTCPDCGGTLYEVDEIATGSNGALSDQGTGRTILACDQCDGLFR